MVAASEQMESDQLENFVMVGELALDGAVRMVKGVLPIFKISSAVSPLEKVTHWTISPAGDESHNTNKVGICSLTSQSLLPQAAMADVR